MGLVNFILSALQFAGVTSVAGAALAVIVCAALWVLTWHRGQKKAGKPGVQTVHVLLFGLLGAWLSITVILAAAAMMVLRPETSASQPIVAAEASDGRPLQFFYSLGMEGGVGGPKVFALTFSGRNISQKEIRLKSASINSVITGDQVPLKLIIAPKQIARVDEINPVPPGAPLNLIAIFNSPDDSIKSDGIPTEDFLRVWSRFNFVVTDESNEYRLLFTEGNVAPFFPGNIGPHVTKKAS